MPPSLLTTTGDSHPSS